MPTPRRSLSWIFLAVAACQPQPKPVEDQSQAAVAAIREADAAWLRVFAGRDTTAAVAAVEATGSVLAPNAPIATGSQAVRSLFEGFYALPGMTISWQLADAQAAKSGDLGYSHGAYQLTFNDPKGKPITDHGKYATVWRKQADGSWKVVLDIFNSDLPAPGM